MPGFDGTGPDFTGPMTGGARGYCTNVLSLPRLGDGRGYGRGRRCQPAGGQRWRRRRSAWEGTSPPDSQTLLARLEQQAAAMQRQMAALTRRIASLASEAMDVAPPGKDGDD